MPRQKPASSWGNGRVDGETTTLWCLHIGRVAAAQQAAPKGVCNGRVIRNKIGPLSPHGISRTVPGPNASRQVNRRATGHAIVTADTHPSPTMQESAEIAIRAAARALDAR